MKIACFCLDKTVLKSVPDGQGFQVSGFNKSLKQSCKEIFIKKKIKGLQLLFKGKKEEEKVWFFWPLHVI